MFTDLHMYSIIRVMREYKHQPSVDSGQSSGQSRTVFHTTDPIFKRKKVCYKTSVNWRKPKIQGVCVFGSTKSKLYSTIQA